MGPETHANILHRIWTLRVPCSSPPARFGAVRRWRADACQHAADTRISKRGQTKTTPVIHHPLCAVQKR